MDYLISEVLSLMTSFSSALGSITAAKGMKRTTPVIASFYCVVVQALILAGLLLINLPKVDPMAIALFAIGGALSLGLGRLLNFIAMSHLGVARTSSLIGSSPVMTVVLSALLLGEPIGMTTIIGAVAVALGLYIMSEAKGLKLERALIIGLLSSFSYALSNIISKYGLKIQPDPILSAQIGAVAGVLFYSLYMLVFSRPKSIRIERTSLGFFAVTGVVSSFGWIALMKALEIGSVSIVTTIVYSYPVFTLLLTRLMMREERLSKKVIIGTGLVVLGVAIVVMLT